MAVKATKGTLSQMSGAELSYTSLANSEIGVADFETNLAKAGQGGKDSPH